MKPTGESSASGPVVSMGTLLNRLECRILASGRQVMPDGWQMGERTLPYHDVLHLLGGAACFSVGRERTRLAAPAWVWFPPGKPHRITQSNGLSVSVIHFECTLGGGVDILPVFLSSEGLELHPDGDAQGSFERAIDAWNQDAGSRQAVARRELEIFCARLVDREATHVTLDQRLLRTLAWVVAQPERLVSMEGAARQAGVSLTHLRRLFKQQLGKPPKDIFQEIRLARARRLLDDGNLSVAEIAQRCGWDEPSGFLKCFRGRFGLSPSRYRLSSLRVLP